MFCSVFGVPALHWPTLRADLIRRTFWDNVKGGVPRRALPLFLRSRSGDRIPCGERDEPCALQIYFVAPTKARRHQLLDWTQICLDPRSA
jgi:hypothetical protein